MWCICFLETYIFSHLMLGWVIIFSMTWMYPGLFYIGCSYWLYCVNPGPIISFRLEGSSVVRAGAAKYCDFQRAWDSILRIFQCNVFPSITPLTNVSLLNISQTYKYNYKEYKQKQEANSCFIKINCSIVLGWRNLRIGCGKNWVWVSFAKWIWQMWGISFT